MLEAVNTYLKAALFYLLDQFSRHLVTLGNKVEGRLEPHFFFKIHQFQNAVMALLGVDVMGKNQGKRLTVRPARPVFGGLCRFGVDGPDVAEAFFLFPDNPAADEKLKAPGNDGLNGVEDFVSYHNFVILR